MTNSRVEQLWEASAEVLGDCALPNGAIVAANSDLDDYPATGENYRYVWMRDSAFQLAAAHALDNDSAADRRKAYLDWLENRAEEFSTTGIVVKRYSTNGHLDWRYGREYQPDQAGALLWSLYETQGYPDRQTERVMRKLANGLASRWRLANFSVPTQDIWENRTANPR